jgi:hypothetical protein
VRGGALGAGEAAGSGSQGAASSESAAGSGPLRGSPARRLFGCNWHGNWPAVESALGRGFGRRADVRVVCWWVWMVVRFVCVIRVPLCARVSRVCHVCSSSSYFVNNRQPNRSLSNVLSKLAVEVRVVGDGETQR